MSYRKGPSADFKFMRVVIKIMPDVPFGVAPASVEHNLKSCSLF